jgi:hypothetical protein
MRYEIEIEGIPDGWEAVAHRLPKTNEHTLSDDNQVVTTKGIRYPVLIIRKKQPRRIVLEETNKTADPEWIYSIRSNDITINIQSEKLWKIVDEKDN